MIKKIVYGFIFILGIANVSAQENLERWFHMDSSEGFQGVSSDKAYEELLKGKKSVPVVVAIIDSGVDIEHEDLKDIIWINKDEIPDNGIDDDKNGYIDDVYGWNFIGGPGGTHVNDETYEVTRLYAKYKKRFENADPEKLNKKDKLEYDKYLKYKKEVEKEIEKAMDNIINIAEKETQYKNSIIAFTDVMDADSIAYTSEALAAYTPESTDPQVMVGHEISKALISMDSRVTSKKHLLRVLETAIADEKKRYENKLNFAYNINFDSRKSIVKDNYADQNERYYGNNDVNGPDALHGTHVAGIVAAIRNNGVGMDGVADNVQIMSIRTVPNGDERDKDVANAIRYAVDNGASIINMSFGKGYSWNKQVVDDAVRYAVKNDVLLVHAAGNSSLDIDVEPNFPNDMYEKVRRFLFWRGKKEAKTWIEVGALSHESGENSVASFSNYGDNQVDIFAPGEKIYATLPNNEYRYLRGTSMAAPVVAGVAAVLRSYFPRLTAKQVKEIIMTTGSSLDFDVLVPGTEEKQPFGELSKSGKVINMYNAVKKAMVTKGKKKK